MLSLSLIVPSNYPCKNEASYKSSALFGELDLEPAVGAFFIDFPDTFVNFVTLVISLAVSAPSPTDILPVNF
jgi:hypothetical protein